jgi:hypothetical protein
MSKNGSFGFACVLGSVRGQKQMCHFCGGLRILKFLRAGKVPIESTKFSCHGQAVKGAESFITMHLTVMLTEDCP